MGGNKLLLILLCLIFVSFAYAVDSKVVNAKTYYKVDASIPSEDSGDEVCALVGKSCSGYSDPTTAVCKTFHPNAKITNSVSGDKAGVYCNGAPQNGVCSNKLDTCHTCPACTVSVQCNQAIGGLYKEMYVECGSGNCKINVNSKNVNDFLNEIPSLNAQLQGCPKTLPKGTSLLASGNNVVDIAMNNGGTQSFTVTTKSGKLIGIKKGANSCQQKLTISENNMNSILTSSSITNQVLFLFKSNSIGLSGCSLWPKIKLIIGKPILNWQIKKIAPPAPPPPKPKPNCGNIGEQCNNRGCFSGICGAPKEQNNGQWGYWNYQCLPVSDWNAKCQGFGNTPPSWNCITGPCS